MLLLSAAGPAAAEEVAFRTAAGDVVCLVGLEETFSEIACSVVAPEGRPAMPRPLTCAGPWGHRFVMTDRGPPDMDCGAPAEAGPEAAVVAEGEAGTFGGIVCEGRRQGLLCRNADGHGFFLSRGLQEVF